MNSLSEKPDSPDCQLDRALPAKYVDAIRDGVPGNYSDVWRALVSTAMSAQLRGWSEAEYITGISGVPYIQVSTDERTGRRVKSLRPSRLWGQVLDRGGGRKRSQKAGIATLARAWQRGADYLDGTGPDSTDRARVRAIRWIDRLEADADELTEREKAVMTYVIGQTNDRGWSRVTCPSREVAEAAKMPQRSALNVLAALAERGLLVKHRAGSRYGPSTPKGRAAIYELGDPDRVGGQVESRCSYVSPRGLSEQFRSLQDNAVRGVSVSTAAPDSPAGSSQSPVPPGSPKPAPADPHSPTERRNPFGTSGCAEEGVPVVLRGAQRITSHSPNNASEKTRTTGAAQHDSVRTP